MSTVAVLTALLFSCKQRPEPAPQAAPSAPPSARPLNVVSEQDGSGLRIRSGTLALKGAASTWGFTDVEVDDARVQVEVVVAPGGAPLEKLLPQGALAVVNGGYFEADFKPSTWLVSGGAQLAKQSDPSKGGVLAIAGHKVYLGPMAGLDFQPSLAVQSFPLIVEADGKSGIHRDDGRRAARTVACLVGSRLHFILLSAPRGEGPTLFESAELLRASPPLGFGCRVALNLDGGPSSGVWFAQALGARQRAPLAHVGYALALRPR